MVMTEYKASYGKRTRIYIPSELIDKLVSVTGCNPTHSVQKAIEDKLEHKESANEDTVKRK